MNTHIVCATLNRRKGVKALLKSLEGTSAQKVAILEETGPRRNADRMGDVLWGAYEAGADIVIWLADDCLAVGDIVGPVEVAFQKNFPALFGAVGLTQVNMPANCVDCGRWGKRDTTMFGFMGLGRALLGHFFRHGQSPFCPDYWHFYADTELGLFANSVGAYLLEPEAQIIHNHPAVSEDKTFRDDTYRACRRDMKADKAAWGARCAKGLLWGTSFDRVTEHGAWRTPDGDR